MEILLQKQTGECHNKQTNSETQTETRGVALLPTKIQALSRYTLCHDTDSLMPRWASRSFSSLMSFTFVSGLRKDHHVLKTKRHILTCSINKYNIFGKKKKMLITTLVIIPGVIVGVTVEKLVKDQSEFIKKNINKTSPLFLIINHLVLIIFNLNTSTTYSVAVCIRS